MKRRFTPKPFPKDWTRKRLDAWAMARLPALRAAPIPPCRHPGVTLLIYAFPQDGRFAPFEHAIRQSWAVLGALPTVVVTHDAALVPPMPGVEVQVEPTLRKGGLDAMSLDCITRLHARFATPHVLIVQDDGTLQISTDSGNVALTVNEAGQPILASASVTTDAIQKGAITIDKLDDSIQLEPPDGSITTEKLADGAVSLDKLDPSIELTPPDGSITTAKLAAGAVTADKIDDGTITANKLAETYATMTELTSQISTLNASIESVNASIQSLNTTLATKANITNPTFKGTITLSE